MRVPASMSEGAHSYIAVETPAGDELLELELKETMRGYEQTARLDDARPGEPAPAHLLGLARDQCR
jgi:hypothetical protein